MQVPQDYRLRLALDTGGAQGFYRCCCTQRMARSAEASESGDWKVV